MKKPIAIMVCGTIYALILFKFISMYFADIAYVKGRELIKDGNYQKALTYAKKAVELNPKEPAYYRGRAKTYLALTVTAESTKDTKSKALESLEKAVKLNPKNLATIRNSIPLYYYLSIKNLAENAETNNLDKTFLPITQKFYQKVKEKYPNDAGVFVSVAKYEKRLGLEEDYKKSIARIKILRPDLLEWHENLLGP